MAEIPLIARGALVEGRYEIRAELGAGEHSRVFEALDRRTGTRVALKLLRPPEPGRCAVSARLLGEMRRLRGFEHPGATRVLQGFEWEGGVGIAMQLVEGPDLAARIAAEGPLEPARVVELATDLARALAAAHARGILHREVKPSKVLIDASGRARLTDFGRLRMALPLPTTREDAPGPRSAFVAPEVVAGRSPDARSDLYGLGMTLYFALTGRLPDGPPGGSGAEDPRDGHHPRRVRGAMPAWLDAVVARCTRAQPWGRFPTATALLAALEQRSCGSGTSADPDLLDVCVLCRQPGTLGRALCPHCEDASDAPENTLVALERASGPRERAARMERLVALSDQHASSALLPWAADGVLALVRVSERQARHLVLRLAAHGLASRCIPADQGWQLLPRRVGWSATGLLAAAIGAGAAGSPLALCALLLLAGLLPPAATALVARVALLPQRSAPRPAAGLVRAVASVMPELESGDARQLLVDCLRLGRALEQRLARFFPASPESCRQALGDTLLAGCDAARELAKIDALLAALELHGPGRFESLPGLPECRALVEDARTWLVQSLLATSATLSQQRSEVLLDAGVIAAELVERACELREAQGFAQEQSKEGLALLAAG